MDRNVSVDVAMGPAEVALRKESVDRNKDTCLSSKLMYQVALRKESVDRNIFFTEVHKMDASRSPQGERG